MTSAKIVKWVENKGFGFVRIDGNQNDVFVHISAFGRIPRSPKVGDVVKVESLEEENGKTRVAKGKIQGLAQIPSRKQSKILFGRVTRRMAIMGAVGAVLVMALLAWLYLFQPLLK